MKLTKKNGIFKKIAAAMLAFALICGISLLYENKKKFFVGEMKNSLKLYIGIVIFFAFYLERITFVTTLRYSKLCTIIITFIF